MEFLVVNTTSRRLQTKQTKFNSVAQLVIQYYYRDGPFQGADAVTKGGIKYGGGSFDGAETGLATNWTKKVDVLAVSGTSVSTDFAYIKVWSHALGGTAEYYIDDVAVYDGSAVDDTPPASPTSPSVTAASSTSLTVSWTAPTTGIDDGGYLVVRGTSDPATVPNVNGVYAVGNIVTSGQTVVYIGTGTSFIDSNLSPGTAYCYRIYAFDKAFNYSGAAGGTAVSGTPGVAAPIAASDSPICAGTTLHLTASTVSGATYAWTGPNGFSSNDQNPTIPAATTTASGTYGVTATLDGSTSPAGITIVAVKALPIGGADTFYTPTNTVATISSAKLKANDTGAGLFLTSVSNPSAQGGTVSLSGADGAVTYTPKTDYGGPDSFTYTLSNDQGCTVQVPVTVAVGPGNSGSANVVYTGTVNGSFAIRFAGYPGQVYTVECTDSLPPNSSWAKLGTANYKAPGSGDSHPYGIGVFEVTDPLGNSSRYYRTVWPAY